MSILYGIVDFDGQLDSEEAANKLYDGCKRFEHSSHNRYIDDNAVLGCLTRINTPQSANEQLPYDDGRYVITSYSRIDDRLKLLNKLEKPSSLLDTITDSELIALSFRKWGKQCVEHLLGDWVFALWDKETKALFLARDHFGNTGCLYLEVNGTLFFCTSIHGLLACHKHLKINEEYLIYFLLNIGYQSNEYSFKDIFRLKFGHYLFRSQSIKTIQCYWDVSTIKEVKHDYKTFKDEFLLKLKASVNDRLRYLYGAAATLSGGLDSGTVSTLVADSLKKENKKLVAYTSVPEYDYGRVLNSRRMFNELEYAQCVVNYNGNIDHRLIQGNQNGVIDILSYYVELHAIPLFASSNLHWLHSICMNAVSIKRNVLFNGQRGNLTISWRGKKDEDWSTIIKKVKIKAGTVKLLKYILFIWNHIKSTDQFEGLFLNKGIGDSENIKKAKLTSRRFWLRFYFISGQSQRQLQFSRMAGSGLLWQDANYEYGIETPDPTADIRLVRMLYSAPNNFFYREKKKRFLIRDTMKGILPDKVRLNEQLGYQSIDNWKRIIDDKERINKTIESWKNRNQIKRVLNLEEMERVLLIIYNSKDCNNYLKYGEKVLRALTVGLFIEKFGVSNSEQSYNARA